LVPASMRTLMERARWQMAGGGGGRNCRTVPSLRAPTSPPFHYGTTTPLHPCCFYPPHMVPVDPRWWSPVKHSWTQCQCLLRALPHSPGTIRGGAQRGRPSAWGHWPPRPLHTQSSTRRGRGQRDGGQSQPCTGHGLGTWGVERWVAGWVVHEWKGGCRCSPWLSLWSVPCRQTHTHTHTHTPPSPAPHFPCTHAHAPFSCPALPMHTLTHTRPLLLPHTSRAHTHAPFSCPALPMHTVR
jgi:hypothetical protein